MRKGKVENNPHGACAGIAYSSATHERVFWGIILEENYEQRRSYTALLTLQVFLDRAGSVGPSDTYRYNERCFS
jgi:hypothetical protein